MAGDESAARSGQSGSLHCVGVEGRVLRRDIPALNKALRDACPGQAILPEPCSDWELTLDVILKRVYDLRQQGLRADRLPALFGSLGLDVDAPLFGGETLAFFACWQGKAGLLCLIQERIDWNQVDSQGRSLEEVAASYGSAGCVALMLSRGLAFDSFGLASDSFGIPLPGTRGPTPLMKAVSSASGCDGVVKLLASPARCSQLDERGRNALMLACERPWLSLESFALLASNSDAGVADEDGLKALDFALKMRAEPGVVACLAALLERGELGSAVAPAASRKPLSI